jgi:hypothetical protein
MTMTFDRELELKKLDTIKETYQVNHELANSIMSTAMIALLVVVVTYGLTNTLNLLGAFLGILVIVIVFIIGFYNVFKMNRNALAHYDKWILDIQNGRPLPTIVQMGKEIQKARLKS